MPMAPSQAIPLALTLPDTSSSEVYTTDGWPLMPDATRWDGTNLLGLLRSGDSPFGRIWDVDLLLGEVETQVGGQVVDIPCVHTGAHNYGFHLRLADGRDVLARLANADVNMPGYGGRTRASRRSDLEFEAATYRLLDAVAEIPSSRLLYYRHCHRRDGPPAERPRDIHGRTLVVFELTRGRKSLWAELDEGQKLSLLAQAGAIRAALLNLALPPDFVRRWTPRRALRAGQLPAPARGSRAFCAALLAAEVEAALGRGGGRGGRGAAVPVGPRARAAGRALRRLIPRVLPEGGDDGGGGLYRLVLQHDDYGIHNMSIDLGGQGKEDGKEGEGEVRVTSVFDWEAARVVPALLSEVDLVVHGRRLAADGEGRPAWRMWDAADEPRPEWHARNQGHAGHYLENIMLHAPYLAESIRAGRDARHLWFALRRWEGEDPERFLGELGSWAEARMEEMRVG